MTIAPTTLRLGATLLKSPSMTVTAQLVRIAEGSRNEYGEWLPGGETVTDLRVVTSPATTEGSGQDREQLPEGLRKADIRKFWLQLEVAAIKAGVSGGDLIRYDSQDWQAVKLNDWGGFRELLCVKPEDIPA